MLLVNFCNKYIRRIAAFVLGLFTLIVSGLSGNSIVTEKVCSPTDTVIVYDTVFEFSPHVRFPRSWVAAASWMPQSGKNSFGYDGGDYTTGLNTNRLSFGRQISLDTKSSLRYRWLKVDADVGVGLREIYITSFGMWYHSSDEYIGGDLHVYEYGGTKKQLANYYTVGPELELHMQIGNFKKKQSRCITELNVGAYAYTAVSSTYRAFVDNYSIHSVLYDNGVREELNYYYGSWVPNDVSYTGSDVQLHLNVREKVYWASGISFFGGYGGTVLLLNDIVANIFTLGLEYKFGTVYERK
ncbi:MAG: hypothetical protein RLZZ252_1805 [Bacteroidota bacterium]|jgi:hypothetical protein